MQKSFVFSYFSGAHTFLPRFSRFSERSHPDKIHEATNSFLLKNEGPLFILIRYFTLNQNAHSFMSFHSITQIHAFIPNVFR